LRAWAGITTAKPTTRIPTQEPSKKLKTSAPTTSAPKKEGAYNINNLKCSCTIANSTVTSSKTIQSTTEKPGKGKLKVNATTTAPKKQGKKNYTKLYANLIFK
jgi:hypothetical protein